MKHVLALFLASCALSTAAALPAQPPSEARSQQLQAILKSLHPVFGDVTIAQAGAVLHLGRDFYYLPPAEARKVIIDGWSNPASVGDGVLGLVFPAGKTFLDDTWGAAITYEGTGYVTDKDAATADFDAILKQLQSGEDEINTRRKQEGYPAQHLVGWAQPPAYDPATHSVVWAQNISFEGQRDNSLNYDLRLLGRKGVLSLNMITGMSKLAETRPDAQKLARSTEFTAGTRYTDFKEGDDKAGYGLAGLVAAGLGVVAVKKLGLLAVILVFAKKFLILIVAGFAALGTRVRKFFGKNKDITLEANPPAEAPIAGSAPSEQPGV